jgi:hypothetical protein
VQTRGGGDRRRSVADHGRRPPRGETAARPTHRSVHGEGTRVPEPRTRSDQRRPPPHLLERRQVQHLLDLPLKRVEHLVARTNATLLAAACIVGIAFFGSIHTYPSLSRTAFVPRLPGCFPPTNPGSQRRVRMGSLLCTAWRVPSPSASPPGVAVFRGGLAQGRLTDSVRHVQAPGAGRTFRPTHRHNPPLRDACPHRRSWCPCAAPPPFAGYRPP